MREIMFRAWDNVKEKMYYVGEESDVVFYFNSCGITAQDITEEDSIESKYLEHLQYMQYTGLHDKNGKEIYEGDLWKTQYHFDGPQSKTPKNKPFIEVIVPIRFYGGAFEPDERGKRYYPYSTTYNNWWDHGEVIGNIYENPELLKEGEPA